MQLPGAEPSIGDEFNSLPPSSSGAMDELAIAAQIDPIDLRLRNDTDHDENNGKASAPSLPPMDNSNSPAPSSTLDRARIRHEAITRNRTLPSRKRPAPWRALNFA